MSSFAPPQQQPPQQQSGGTGTQQSQQGLPPTGLQQQMNSLNNLYNQIGNAPGGFNVQQQQFNAAQQQQGGAGLPADGSRTPMGSTSLDQMARNLAERYGLPIGRGRLVDESGNFLMTPQQLADASGGSVTLGEAASQMNYISQALTRKQNEQQQQKGLASLQTGLGLVQSRGRGSLAAMQSGYYQDIADLYANQQYEAADFSYYIQKEQMDMASQLQARQEKMAKKQARTGMITGIGLGVAGILMGNPMMAVGGFTSAAGQSSQTGWF